MRYADPVAQAEIDRLQAKLDDLAELARRWQFHGQDHYRHSAGGQLAACGRILLDRIESGRS